MKVLDFSELHRELTAEFTEQYVKSKEAGWRSWPHLYYSARAPAVAACVANLPGSKLALATDEPAGLTEQIRKFLLFTDHVIIRHKSLLPLQARFMLMGDVPLDFAGFHQLPFIERNLSELNKISVLPHFSSVTEEIPKFLDWVIEEGKPWVEHGLVTYAPVLPVEDVEIACAEKGMNLNDALRKAHILPLASERLNEKTAAALQLLEIPYLANVDPETLLKVRRDNRPALDNFRSTLLRAFDEVDNQVGSVAFEREVKIIFQDIVAKGLREVETGLKEAAKMRALKQRTVFATTCLIGLSFWSGAPSFVVAGSLAKPIWDFASALLAHHEELANIRQKPMYILAAMKRKM
ncbi:MAG TPA: hypothetical protein VI685_22755 [Candidatus Angelobacter sp.]